MWTVYLWFSIPISDLMLWAGYWNIVLWKTKGNVLTELGGCEFLKIFGFMQLVKKRIFKFEREEMKSICLFQDGDTLCAFVNPAMNIFFPQNGVIFFLLCANVSFLSTLLYITQFINTHIDPVCPDHLILRYCSCNTYLLHRRAELKAAPRWTWLMRNWTLGNKEPLTVSTYISVAISCCA
jgi:hypothetical protein